MKASFIPEYSNPFTLMHSQVALNAKGHLRIQKIGGIDDLSLTFQPGVTVLAGRNATNRTSILRAIMAAFGSDDVSVKGDADTGKVELELGDQTYSRTLTQTSDSIRFSGDPHPVDTTITETFAFLLETNDARQAVLSQQNLRDVIMRPVNTHEIEAEISQLKTERANVESEIDEIESLKGDLPELEQKRTSLETEIEETRTQLEAKRDELDELDGDVEEKQEQNEKLEAKLDEIRSTRSELEEVRYDLETEQETLKTLANERTELESELEEFESVSSDRQSELGNRIDRLRRNKQQVEREVTEIQNVIQFNEEMLEGDATLLDQIRDQSEEQGALTDELLEGDETISCWTCGTEVDTDEIEQTLDTLRELSRQQVQEQNDLEEEIRELKSEKRSLDQQQQRREKLERKLDRTNAEITETESNIDRLKDRRDELRAEIEDLEAEIDELEDDSYSEILDVNKEINELEYELGRLESDLDRVTAEIDEIESRIDDLSDREARLERINSELEELRTKVEEIETTAIEEFNENMDSILDILEYRNIERIWLERIETEVREGREKVTKSTFELHVVRRTDSGIVYEDSVNHLSESEREVTGLVFALAGYLAHDLHEKSPIMLLDSVEAIDSERIATLVEFFSQYSEYLIVALLEEDANALSEEYQQISTVDIES